MSNYKTGRDQQINLRISAKELALLDKLVSDKSSYWNKKSRTDIIINALELLNIVITKQTEVKRKDDVLHYIADIFKVVYSNN